MRICDFANNKKKQNKTKIRPDLNFPPQGQLLVHLRTDSIVTDFFYIHSVEVLLWQFSMFDEVIGSHIFMLSEDCVGE